MTEFQYYGKNGKIQKLNLEIGQKWNAAKVDNEFVNSIFNNVDNGDGYLSEFEIMQMDKILSKADTLVKETANDKILTNKELELIHKKEEYSDYYEYIDDLKCEAISKININDFSLEGLKKRYKEPRFSVTKTEPNRYGEVFIVVTDNERNKKILSVCFDDYDIFIEPEGENSIAYDFSGKRDNGATIISNIEYILDSKKAENEKVNEIEKEINQFTKYNAGSAMFYDMMCSHVVKRIIEDRSININSRLALVKHIVYKLFSFVESKGIDCSVYRSDLDKELKSQKRSLLPAKGDGIEKIITRLLSLIKRVNKGKEKPANGKIDADFAQGGIGDCWCLAAIKSISMNPKGQKLLSDSLKVDSTGNVTVTLKGVNKTYKITKEELERMKGKYSYGDKDVRAIEIAVDKYIKESSGSIGGLIGSNFNTDINGNHSSFAYYILTGKGKENVFKRTGKRIQGISDSDIDNFKGKIISAGTTSSFNTVSLNGGRDKLIPKHAYTVTRVDKNKVYLINPHDSSREFSLTRAQFKKYFTEFYDLEL